MKEKTTDLIRDALQQYVELKTALPTVMRACGFWQQRVPIEEQITFLRTLGQSHAALEREVMREYPQFLGQAFTVTPSYVFDQDSEQPPSTNAAATPKDAD